MRVTFIPELEKYPHAWPMTWNLVEVWEPNRRLGPSRHTGCFGRSNRQRVRARRWRSCENTRVDGQSKRYTWYSRVAVGWRILRLENWALAGKGRDNRRGGGGANRVVAGSGGDTPRPQRGRS